MFDMFRDLLTGPILSHFYSDKLYTVPLPLPVAMQQLFFALATMEISFFGLYMALGKNTSFAALVEKLLQIAFIYYILTNWMVFSRGLLDSLVQLAGSVLGFSDIVKIQTHIAQSYDTINPLDPDSIVAYGYSHVMDPLASLINNLNKGLAGQDLFNFNISYLFSALYFAIVSAVVGLSFMVMGLQVFIAVIEFYAVTFIAFICFPFVVFEPTKFIGEKSIPAVFGQVAKLLILAIVTYVVILAMTSVLPTQYIKDLQSVPSSQFPTYLSVFQAHFPDKLAAGSIVSAESQSDYIGVLMTQIMVMALAAMLIHWVAPSLVQAFLGGMPQFSGGTFSHMLGGAIRGASNAMNLYNAVKGKGKGGGDKEGDSGGKGAVDAAKSGAGTAANQGSNARRELVQATGSQGHSQQSVNGANGGQPKLTGDSTALAHRQHQRIMRNLGVRNNRH